MNSRCLIILLALSTAACFRIVEIDLPVADQPTAFFVDQTPDGEPSLVISSNIPLSSYYLYGFDETTPIDQIGDAQVKMWRDGVFAGQWLFDTISKIYRPEVSPTPGSWYTFVINRPNGDEHRAESYFPLTGVLQSATGTQKGNNVMEVVIELKDVNPTVKNYYSIELRSDTANFYWFYQFRSKDVNQIDYPSSPIDEVFSFDSEGPYLNRIYISDDAFIDGKYTLRLDECFVYGMKVVPQVHTFSEESFQFRYSVELQYFVAGDPFSQPVELKGNVSNAQGFIGFDAVERILVPF